MPDTTDGSGGGRYERAGRSETSATSDESGRSEPPGGSDPPGRPGRPGGRSDGPGRDRPGGPGGEVDDDPADEAERRRKRAVFLREMDEAKALRERVHPRRARANRMRQQMRMRTFRW